MSHVAPSPYGGEQLRGNNKPTPSFFNRTLGVVGEILITLGVILGLFVLWQVGWTSFWANRAQGQEISQITNKWGDPFGKKKIGKPRYDEPPAADHLTNVGDLEGIIYIPRFGLNWRYTVKYGNDKHLVLDAGSFGHTEGTQYVGEIGNYALAAHRNTYGDALRDAPSIENGDSIIVQTDKAYYVYKQIDKKIVYPTDVWVLEPDPFNLDQAPTRRLMTLTTCHPFFSNVQRHITFAEFDHWVDVNDGVPEELAR